MDEILCILGTHSTATYLQALTPQYTCHAESRASWERKIERSTLWHKPAKEILGELILWEDLLLATCTNQAKCTKFMKLISRRRALRIRWSRWSPTTIDQIRSGSKVTTVWMARLSDPLQRRHLV